MNAVMNAIGTEISMPATAEKVWKACKENKKINSKAA